MDWTDLAPQLTGYAHLATVTPDGRPHISKVSPVVEDHTVWIGTWANSAKVRNLDANPQAALMWEPTAEVYLASDVAIVRDVPTKQRLWDSGLFPYPMEAFFGSPEDDNFVLLRLTPTRATVISAAESGLRRDTWRAPTGT